MYIEIYPTNSFGGQQNLLNGSRYKRPVIYDKKCWLLQKILESGIHGIYVSKEVYLSLEWHAKWKIRNDLSSQCTYFEAADFLGLYELCSVETGIIIKIIITLNISDIYKKCTACAPSS